MVGGGSSGVGPSGAGLSGMANVPSGDVPPDPLAAIQQTLAQLLGRMDNFEERLANNNNPPSHHVRHVEVPVNPPEEDLNARTMYVKDMKPEDVGFFYPDMDGDEPVKQIGRDMFYKDVNVFVDRVRDVVKYRGEKLVKSNLQACLRGTALTWFTSGMSELEKSMISEASLENGWLKGLLDRFRPSPSAALLKLDRMHYGFNDVNTKPIGQFAQDVIRYARAARMEDPFNQLLCLWNRIDARLRVTLTKPTEQTSVGAFLKELDDQQQEWEDLVRTTNRHDSRMRGNAPQNQSHGNQGPRNQGYPQGRYDDRSINRDYRDNRFRNADNAQRHPPPSFQNRWQSNWQQNSWQPSSQWQPHRDWQQRPYQGGQTQYGSQSQPQPSNQGVNNRQPWNQRNDRLGQSQQYGNRQNQNTNYRNANYSQQDARSSDSDRPGNRSGRYRNNAYIAMTDPTLPDGVNNPIPEQYTGPNIYGPPGGRSSAGPPDYPYGPEYQYVENDPYGDHDQYDDNYEYDDPGDESNAYYEDYGNAYTAEYVEDDYTKTPGTVPVTTQDDASFVPCNNCNMILSLCQIDMTKKSQTSRQMVLSCSLLNLLPRKSV
ncbi:uncharacterized protein BP01DRAFT_387710 [Aspergillus saccharolyticus JOP 1030-1]|uniref:Uncharacterized protein n=1 Tax=Aspergillus saccharolyticus JOP 1030-1 TaxID=1450539 RepID=A0A318YYF5_9EURO|nr:hypothetical protein BP01DRAFT_387710 [Aspergillus saccharolyticus JOP 1030-1]PYH40031.1 hypothetical protein BP01DRAFT_387710 [Aspergillus saccharolyticus JOP 1030-1]